MTRVLVVGASARAAVHSLARAGVSAAAIDLFGDRDLARVAECVVCPTADYPGALPKLAKRFPDGPLLYTGGLENYPDIVAELSASRELWGSPPDVLRRVRDPFSFAAGGFAGAPVAPCESPCPVEGRWLRKPLRSGGGFGIRFALPNEPPSPQHYFQQFIDGVAMSALYSGTTLLGVTEQLIGERWLHARPFAYCGNIGPVAADVPKVVSGLNGVWGCDFVLGGEGPRAVEVNPRYTAAVEVIEHASGRPTTPGPSLKGGELSLPSPLAGEGGGRFGPPGEGALSHAVLRSSSDFDRSPLTRLEDSPPSPARGEGKDNSPPPFRDGPGVGLAACVGKAVYYAPRAFAFPASGPWDADLTGPFDPWKRPRFADIPHPGAAVEAGSPVLTFFAHGSSVAEVRERLQSRAAELDLLFAESPP